jgi:spore coat protein CotF
MSQQQQGQQQQVQPQFTIQGGHVVMYHQDQSGSNLVKDSNVNDRDRLVDVLTTEKYLTEFYTHAMHEAGTDQLFQLFQQNFNSCMQLQRQHFNAAFKKGWYRLPVADAQTVVAAHEQFKQLQSEFPFPSQISGQQNQGNQQQLTQGQKGRLPQTLTGQTRTVQQQNSRNRVSH